MAEITILLWDIGGVVLSNAWDHSERASAVAHFQLDPNEFERRHAQVVDAFEQGRMDLDRYLSETVFYAPRPFTPQKFFQFMCACSHENASALECARSIRRAGHYGMIALNNESRELNEARIATFQLRRAFQAFFSSCYTGLKKPDPRAFRIALEFTQCDPSEVLFLDDRRENVDAAIDLGIRGLWIRDPDRIREDLLSNGVDVP